MKRLKALENATGVNTKLVKHVDYESMILRHRLAATSDATMDTNGMFPFGKKDEGQKVLTLQKSLFGCARMIKALDAAAGSVSNTDPRTLIFTNTYSDSTILNQGKHTVNVRLTKLIAKHPRDLVQQDASGANIAATPNPDRHMYINHLYHDHTDPDAADRLKRFLYPDFKSAYSAPVSRDWKAMKEMTIKLDPGKSIQIKCKQRNFKCDRAYLADKAWMKGACTWLIEAWGELCHVGAQGVNQQTLDPIANFNISSTGSNGLLLPGDVSLDIYTKYHTCVSYTNAAEKRQYVVNVPTTVVTPALAQIGVDMYQEIADDN